VAAALAALVKWGKQLAWCLATWPARGQGILPDFSSEWQGEMLGLFRVGL